MTENSAVQSETLNIVTWLTALLTRHSKFGILPDDVLSARLSTIALMDIVSAIEQAELPPGSSEAIQLYQRWLASQSAGSTNLHLAWFNLGVAYTEAQDRPSAIFAYQNALALRPDFYLAAINLGNVLEAVGQTDAALQTWARSLQPDETRVTLLNNRVRLLELSGRLEEAEQEARRSLLVNPEQPDLILHWVHIRQRMCAWPILSEEIPGLSTADMLRHAGPMATLALSDDVGVQSEACRDWIARKTSPIPLTLSPQGGYRHDRIRLGYLSSDFCSHAMSYLIVELFERHDRDRFEVFGYCSSPDDGSDIRMRVVQSFDHYRQIRDISDEQAAQLIRRDEIDILIDLNGLTAGFRPQILRSKPAPVQATYLGFVGPVPLPELDYMLCDATVVPPDRAAAYEPIPLYVSECYQSNDTNRRVGKAISRADVGLPEQAFIFCCFSRHYKITREMFSAWTEILRAASNSVLWLAHDNAWSEANLRTVLARAGIANERLIFANRTDPDSYISRLRLPDLFLDTFPYNAGTVASDALRMGLPLLTLCGEAFASRMASSLLSAIGQPEGITTSHEEYVAKAIRLATEVGTYGTFRAKFSHGAWARSVGNIGRFTADFESTITSLIK